MAAHPQAEPSVVRVATLTARNHGGGGVGVLCGYLGLDYLQRPSMTLYSYSTLPDN